MLMLHFNGVKSQLRISGLKNYKTDKAQNVIILSLHENNNQPYGQENYAEHEA